MADSSSVNTRTIDHIVHLTPPGTVDSVSEQFRELGFNVVRGGTHADGLTANALVVLHDGAYLELISFTHPVSYYPPGSPERTKRENNAWASKSPGWIDYAFLGNGSRITRISDIINQRAEKDRSGAVYEAEVDGGRVRPDGEVLKWLISAPQTDKRGVLPFFCGDVTPRRSRVPSEPPINAEHPSTVQGLAFIRVLTNKDNFSATAKQITSVIGHEPISGSDAETIWQLDTAFATTIKPQLILSLPSNDEEAAFNSATVIGIYEVAFYVQEGADHDGTTPYGKIRWVKLSE